MVGAFLLAAAAIVVAVVATAAASGRLRRNPVAGIRIASLFTSEETWRNGHRAAVLPTAGAALVCVLLAVAVFVVPAFAEAGSIAETAVLVVGVLVGAALADRAARKQAP